MNLFGEVISSYSRAEAIDDGVLIDVPVSALAREYGIKYPCAMTARLFGALQPKPGSHEDLTGRIWDMLTMFRIAARAGGSEILFQFVMSGRRVTVKALCGPGDNMEPVITFMMPEED